MSGSRKGSPAPPGSRNRLLSSSMGPHVPVGNSFNISPGDFVRIGLTFRVEGASRDFLEGLARSNIPASGLDRGSRPVSRRSSLGQLNSPAQLAPHQTTSPQTPAALPKSSVLSGTNSSLMTTQIGPSLHTLVGSQGRQNTAGVNESHANQIWYQGIAQNDQKATRKSSHEQLRCQLVHMQVILANLPGTAAAVKYLRIHAQILNGRSERLGLTDSYVQASNSSQLSQQQQEEVWYRVMQVFLTRAAAFLLGNTHEPSSIKLDSEDLYFRYMTAGVSSRKSNRSAVWRIERGVRNLVKEILKEVFEKFRSKAVLEVQLLHDLNLSYFQSSS